MPAQRGSGVTIRVKFNNLGAIAAAMPDAVDLVLEKFIIDVDADAAVNTPVDQGYLKNSREVGGKRIYWPAHYAAYQNFGTRFMAARPFATNAVDKAMPGAQAAFADLESMLR